LASGGSERDEKAFTTYIANNIETLNGQDRAGLRSGRAQQLEQAGELTGVGGEVDGRVQHGRGGQVEGSLHEEGQLLVARLAEAAGEPSLSQEPGACGGAQPREPGAQEMRAFVRCQGVVGGQSSGGREQKRGRSSGSRGDSDGQQ
jgi:hypothetical protein